MEDVLGKNGAHGLFQGTIQSGLGAPGGLTIPARTPDASNNWAAPEKYARGTLDTPIVFGNFDSTEPVADQFPDVPYTCPLRFLPGYETIKGTHVLYSPCFVATGYVPVAIRRSGTYFAMPQEGTVVTPVGYNHFALKLAREAQEGRLLDYEETMRLMFTPHGIIQTVTGEDLLSPLAPRHYLPRGSVNTDMRGKQQIRMLWGPGMRTGTELLLKAQLYDPVLLQDLPYNMDPLGGTGCAEWKLLQDLLGNRPHPLNKSTLRPFWPMQVSPVQAVDPMTKIYSYDRVEDSLWYYDSEGCRKRAMTYRFGSVLFYGDGSVVDVQTLTFSGAKKALPDACVNASTLANTHCVTVGLSAY